MPAVLSARKTVMTHARTRTASGAWEPPLTPARLRISGAAPPRRTAATKLASLKGVVRTVWVPPQRDPRHIHWLHRKVLDVFSRPPQVQCPQPRAAA
jgi:hypothetical protein